MSTLITNARLVDVDRDEPGDCLIEQGRITSLGTGLSCPAHAEVVDAGGRVLMPAVIDPHVHFNDPGRADWEGVESGSKALLAGGGTLYFDMPLNCSPVVTTVDVLLTKAKSIQGRSHANFGLWGGIVPGNSSEWAAMLEAGAVGLKAFLCHSGLDEFPDTPEPVLIDAMEVAADVGGLIAVHAELDALTVPRDSAAGESVSDWLASRPIEAELAAVEMAIAACRQTGAKTHIVHVSAGRVMDSIKSAVEEGLPLTAETCAHYLFFTDQDVREQGAVAKCAPPIRPREQCEALWTHVESGHVSWVCSDHSPAPPDMKTSADFFSIWGGISGVQHTLQALLTSQRLPLSQVSGLVSSGIADRWGMPDRGRLREGNIADLLLLDPDAAFRLNVDDLRYRHPQSPYVGKELRGRVDVVWQDGQKLFEQGTLVQQGQGKWIKIKRGVA